jgi:hypothetical protein
MPQLLLSVSYMASVSTDLAWQAWANVQRMLHREKEANETARCF